MKCEVGRMKRLGICMDDDNVVNFLMPNSPAASSGLKLGDVVIAWQGIPLDGRRLQDVLQESPVHSITVARAVEQRDSVLNLGALISGELSGSVASPRVPVLKTRTIFDDGNYDAKVCAAHAGAPRV